MKKQPTGTLVKSVTLSMLKPPNDFYITSYWFSTSTMLLLKPSVSRCKKTLGNLSKADNAMHSLAIANSKIRKNLLQPAYICAK